MKSDMDFEQEKQQKTERKRALGCLIFTIVVLAISTTVGLLVHSLRPQPTLQGDILVRTEPVGDCHPQPGGDQDKCEAAGCTWKQVEGGGPSCTFPSGYGYKMSDEPVMTPLGQKVDLERILQTRDLVQGSPHINKLTVEVQEFSKDTLRVLYQDYADNRYKVPAGAIVIPVEGKPSKPDDKDKLYDIEFIKEPQFGVKVTRRSTNTVIFDTSITGFIFSEQYLQITNRLPSSHLYGLGEHNHRQFKHDMNWRKWTLFTRDVAPVDEWNLYGQQPHYMNLENDSNANAVLLLNSNAMDVVLQPDDYPAITYHVIGGVLDFYIFLGPTPENVVQQYTWATGRPMLPPYWSLGFQLSRWDYHNLTHVEEIIDRNRKEGIPLDVQYGDIDYMESKLDFTYDKVLYKDLPAFIDRIHSYGMKYIIILDHCIGSNETLVDEKLGGTYLPLSQGKDKDVFIIDPRNKQPLEGEVWPGVVYYPDFTNNSTVTDWWIDQCNDFYSGPRWGVKYDALWIDMNEPSNFLPGSMTGCEKNKLNNPPYIPNVLGAGDDGRLYDKTICMDAEQNWGKHYNVHSLYGHSMAIVTWKTLKDQFPDKRPLVLTRSQFTGSQKYAGHWLGDNQSQWRQIPWSIIGMLEYSLFGFSYTGADICGFWYGTTEEMCQRWMQLGAFYPFARNHNAQGWPDQDPAAFSQEMISVSRDILMTRYKLLPFLYTLMWEAHREGNTVVRPLMHEFTSDNQTWAVDRQFLWGPSFMISPAMEEKQEVVTAYIPNARWYDYYGGKEFEGTGAWHNLTTPLDKINLHVRGGHIIPYQQPANTTVSSRKNPFGLIVALGEQPTYISTGRFIWDDGVTDSTNKTYIYLDAQFNCKQEAGLFTMTVAITSPQMNTSFGGKLEDTEIWGLAKRPTDVKLNDTPINDRDITFNPVTKAISIYAVMDLDAPNVHTITWKIVH